MLKVPQTYLNSILSNFGIEKDLSKITLNFILNDSKNLHFIIDEIEIDSKEILCNLSLQKHYSNNEEFTFKKGQRLISLQRPQNGVFVISVFTSQFDLKKENDERKAKICTSNLENFIPLSNSPIQSIGTIQNRIKKFKEMFEAKNRNDFFNNEKLLVVGNQSLFKSIPKEYPSCLVTENDKGQIEIEYNSPLLAKICVLKNINLLDLYLEKEINGEHLTFSTCIFVGSPKFEHSINIIRNYYNQKKIKRMIFIGEKDIKLHLGNDQIPLRWKWTVPEIKYLKGERVIEHERIIVKNSELDNAISNFYKTIYDIGTKHTVNLKSLFRYIRRLYYDWTLKLDSYYNRINQIRNDFETALNEILIDVFSNIDPDFDYREYQSTLESQFNEILNAIRRNNKTERIKEYKTFINQFVTPSFLHNNFKSELNQLYKQSQKHTPTMRLDDLSKIGAIKSNFWNNSNREYYSLISEKEITEIKSFAKSDDNDEQLHKLLSSIYGNGRIDRLIERLAKAKTKYNLLVYEIEERTFNYHIEKYVEGNNHEYASQDRYHVSGVEFNDPYYQFSTFDQLIEALAETGGEISETELYKITFTDDSLVKLPATKNVLKVLEEDKYTVLIEELEAGDKVQIYINPDKETLHTIFELKHPEMIKKADAYSKLWQNCLLEYFSNSSISEDEFYQRLVRNRFSVSKHTLRRYLNRDVTFPRRKIDLIAIARTVNDSRLNFEFVRNVILPFIHDYNGKLIEYGFKLSESVNNYLTSRGMDEFISEWYSKNEVEQIASQIPVKTIKDIELLTRKSEDNE